MGRTFPLLDYSTTAAPVQIHPEYWNISSKADFKITWNHKYHHLTTHFWKKTTNPGPIQQKLSQLETNHPFHIAKSYPGGQKLLKE